MATPLSLSTLLDYTKVQSKKVSSNAHFAVNLISLEKGNKLKAHTSPTDAVVVVLNGHILFHIEGAVHSLRDQDLISFEKNQVHEVEAVEDSKIILIR